MISLENVYKIYKMGGEEIFALGGVSMDIQEGEFISVVGPSGSGKSTLLNLVGGLDRPTGGDLFVDELHLNKLSDRRLSRYRSQEVGFIFQTFNLDPTLSALDNVAMPLIFANTVAGKRKKIATDLLTWVGLGNRLRHRPTELSGGQRQRVAIARALINRPRILLADEPTGNLDSKSGEHILEILRGINGQLGVTVILVTHDLEAAQKAQKMYQLHDGKII